MSSRFKQRLLSCCRMKTVVSNYNIFVVILKVYATDRDASDNARISYELLSDPSGFFTIDSHTGWVTVARPMTGVTCFA